MQVALGVGQHLGTGRPVWLADTAVRAILVRCKLDKQCQLLQPRHMSAATSITAITTIVMIIMVKLCMLPDKLLLLCHGACISICAMCGGKSEVHMVNIVHHLICAARHSYHSNHSKQNLYHQSWHAM